MKGEKKKTKMEIYEEIEKDNKVLRIYHDYDPQNPRENGFCDNLGIIVCNHKNYNLSDSEDLNLNN